MTIATSQPRCDLEYPEANSELVAENELARDSTI